MSVDFFIAGSKGQLAKEFIKIFESSKVSYAAYDLDDLNISDYKQVKEFINRFKPKYIINCAAYNLVDKAETDWEDAFSGNGIGVKNLAIAAKENDSIFVHYSSDYVFNGEKQSAYTIADIPSPLNRYGESKLLGERFTEFAEHYYLIRTSWVFGDGANSFPVKVLQWAEGKDSLKIVDDQISSPTYAKDLAEITLKLVETGSYGLYHLTNKGYCSRYQWAKLILEESGWKGELLKGKSSDFITAAKRPEFSVLDNFPIKVILGEEMRDWQEATKDFLKNRGNL